MANTTDNDGSHFEIIKNELEEVKQEFLWLINEIAINEWDRKIAGEGWSAKEELVHMAQALEVLPKGIQRAIGESGRRSLLSYIPSKIRGWVNGYIIIPIRSRRSTKKSIVEEYEKASNELVEILGEITEEDWGKGAPFPRKYRTVEQMAQRPREHFEEHATHLCSQLKIKR